MIDRAIMRSLVGRIMEAFDEGFSYAEGVAIEAALEEAYELGETSARIDPAIDTDSPNLGYDTSPFTQPAPPPDEDPSVEVPEPRSVRIYRNKSDPLFCMGEAKTIKEWVADPRCSITYSALLTRLRKGWGVKRAILNPSGMIELLTIKIVSEIFSDFNLRGMSMKSISEERGLTYGVVYGICKGKTHFKFTHEVSKDGQS